MQTLSFDVSGMTCGGCTGSVQRALSKSDGVGHAEVTLRPGVATVVADPGKPSDRERSRWYFQRLNLMRDILSRLHYAGKNNKLVQPDPDIAFEFTPDCIDAERLAR